jgi:Uma2 family endonuclease
MMYVSNELRAKMAGRRTSADIVFEYLSASNATYDRTTKADTYLALGASELWLIDSRSRTIEIRNRREIGARRVWDSCTCAEGETAESEVLSGWQVSVDWLFAGLSTE